MPNEVIEKMEISEEDYSLNIKKCMEDFLKKHPEKAFTTP